VLLVGTEKRVKNRETEMVDENGPRQKTRATKYVILAEKNQLGTRRVAGGKGEKKST